MENWVMRGRGMAFLGAGARGGLALVLVLALVERGAGTCVEECADESATDCWRELSSAGNGKECTAKTNDWVRISVGSDADCLAGCCAEEGVERDHVEYNTLTKSCKCGVCTAYGDKSWDRYRLFTIPAVTSTTCAAGLYHDGDFVCVDCGVGTFKAASGTATSCDPCAADTYQDAEGQTTCTDCPGDSTTASDTGRTAKGDCVLGCPEGQRHDGDGACVNCGAGTFKVGTNTATSCDACGTDTYQDVEGQEECTACPGASTSDARSGRDAKSDCELTCAAGEFHTGEGVCADCAAGRYKAASGTEVSCTACTAGYQDETKQAECKACPGGSASLDGSGRDEKSDCVMTCGEGVYHTGEGVCANCAAGTSKADENTDTTCSDCEVDTYQNLEGQEECKTCPRNSASGVVVGARDDVADCKCLLGYEADDFGMDCTKCALGAYKNWTGPGACVQCAAAFHTTAAEGEVSEDACLCMSGFGAIPSGFPEEGTCIGASRLSPGNRFAGAGMLEMRVTGDSLSPSDLSLQARFGGTAAERTRWESSTSVALLAPGGVGHGLGVAITVSQVVVPEISDAFSYDAPVVSLQLARQRYSVGFLIRKKSGAPSDSEVMVYLDIMVQILATGSTSGWTNHTNTSLSLDEAVADYRSAYCGAACFFENPTDSMRALMEISTGDNAKDRKYVLDLSSLESSARDVFQRISENVAVADITSQNNNTFVEAVDEELGTSNVFRFLKIGDELIQLSDESKYAEDEEEGGKVEVDANGTCTGYTRDDNRTIIGANFGMTSFTSASRIGVTATEFTEWISDTVVQVMMSAGVGAAWSAVMSVGNQFGTQSEAYTYDKVTCLFVDVENVAPHTQADHALTGANFGFSRYSAAVRFGYTGGENTVWISDSSVEARSAMQFAGDNYRKLVATLGMQSVTMVGGYRVDVPWTTAVSERNYPGSPSAEQLLQVVTGKNFGVVEMTDIKARMGGTAAELTAWTTDTGIKALILWPPMLSEPVQNVVVTSARHSGTSNNLFSYDAPQIRVEFLGDVMRNARAVGGKIFTVLGANLGSSFLSQGARVGGSSTELTSWMSESALEVKISAGVGDTLPVVAFVAQEMGTVTEALSYDQPAASNIDESSLKKDDDYSDYSQRWDEIIRLAGSNFGTAARTHAIRMGHTACEKTEWSSDSSISCKAASGVGGSLRVGVTIGDRHTLSGQATLTEAFSYALFIFTNRAADWDGSMTVRGWNFGGAQDMTPGARFRETGCDATDWISDSALLCKTPIYVGSSAVLRVTLGLQARTAEFSHDVPSIKTWVHGNETDSSDSRASVSITGGGFLTALGLSTYSAAASVRLGGSDCEKTAWVSETTLICSARVTVGGFLRVAVTAAVQVGTATEAVSFDTPDPSELSVFRGQDWNLTLEGTGFGVDDYSARVRAGSTACEETEWRSDVDIACQAANGVGARGAMQITAAVQVGTLQAAFNYFVPFPFYAARANQASGSEGTLTLSGRRFGRADYTPMARAGVTACEATIWVSDTSAECLATMHGVGGTQPVSMTVGLRSGTRRAWSYSFDAPSVRGVLNFTNLTTAGEGEFVEVDGAGFGDYHYSPTARVGATQCETTEWASDSSVTCTVGGGVSGTLSLAVTAAFQVGTLTEALSFEAPILNNVGVVNFPGSPGNVTVVMEGWAFGAGDYTASGRVGGTACEATTWNSDKAVSCIVATGVASTLHLALTVGGLLGSTTEIASFDTPVIHINESAANNPRAGTSDAILIMGAGYGVSAHTLQARVGETGCEATAWTSDSSVECGVGVGVAMSHSLAVTAARSAATLIEALSYDAPVLLTIAEANHPPAGDSNAVVVGGVGFGVADYTAQGRVGGTACEATAWESDGAVLCMNVTGLFGTRGVAVTAGGRGGTISEVLSYDVPVVGSVSEGNLASAGENQTQVTFSGQNFGGPDFSPSSRVGHSACEATAWESDDAVVCGTAPGYMGTLRVAVTAGNGAGTLSDAISFDALVVFAVGNLGSKGGGVVEVSGEGFGSWNFTGAARSGYTACETTVWESDESIMCMGPAGVSSTLRLAVTAGVTVGSVTEATTFDVPTVLMVGNLAPGGTNVSLVSGKGFGTQDYTSAVRTGFTACEATVWESDSTIVCSGPAIAGGVSGTLPIVVTSGGSSGTLTDVFSMDVPAISSLFTSNAASTGSASVTVFGSAFGVHQYSVTSRADGTRCESTDWDTDTELRCRVPSGRAGTLRATVTSGIRSGTVTEALSFDAASLMSASGVNAPASDTTFNLTGVWAHFEVTAAGRLGGSAAEATRWWSASSLMCQAGLGVGATMRIAVTAGGAPGTVTEAFSIDVFHGVPLSANIRTLNSAAISLGYDGGVRDDYSARARLGDTGCETTTWASTTSVSCIPARGVGASLYTAVTAGMQVGSISKALSYDLAGFLPDTLNRGRNGPTPGGTNISLAGHNLGPGHYSQGAAVGVSPTHAEATEWVSDSFMVVKAARGHPSENSGEVLVVSVQGRIGTLANVFSFDKAVINSFSSTGTSFGNTRTSRGAPISVTITGQNFATYEVTSHFRTGATVAEATEWVSQTQMSARLPAGEGAALTLALTMAPRVLSYLARLSYDKPVPLGTSRRNVPGGKHVSTVISGGTLASGFDSSPRVRFGGTAAATSRWVSDSWVTCMTSAGVTDQRTVVATVAMQAGTITDVLSYDAPAIQYPYLPLLVGGQLIVIGATNTPTTGKVTIGISGTNFALHDSTTRARAGVTSASSTKWFSDTLVTCRPSPGVTPLSSRTSAGGTATILTVGRLHTSLTYAITYDAPSVFDKYVYLTVPDGAPLPVGDSNSPAAGGRTLSLEASNAGLADFTVRARLAGTATESTAWASDKSVACKAAAGARGLVRVAITVGGTDGTTTDFVSYDVVTLLRGVDGLNSRSTNGTASPATSNLASTPSGTSTLIIKARDLSNHDMTVRSRVGGTVSEATKWVSDTAMWLRAPRGVGGSLKMVATLATLYNTQSSALSYDAPSLHSSPSGGASSGVSPANIGHGGRGANGAAASLTLAGSNFGISKYSHSARTGGTGCEASLWHSESSVACRVPQGRGGTLRAAVTVGWRVGSVTEALSFDAPSPLTANLTARSVNLPATPPDKPLRITGSAFGDVGYSQRAAVGGSAALVSEWVSDVAVLCRPRTGLGLGHSIVVSVATLAGTLEGALSFDAAYVTAVFRTNLVTASDTIITVFGTNFAGTPLHSPTARFGGTAATASAWASDSTVLCQAATGLNGVDTFSAAVTVARSVASMTEVVSYDRPSFPPVTPINGGVTPINAGVTPINAGVSGRGALVMHGVGFGRSDYSWAGTLGQTGLLLTSWASDSAVAARIPPAVTKGSGLSLVATLGRVSGTAVALFTYDGAAAKSLQNSNAFCLARSVITVFGSNLGAVGVTALARIGNSVCEASIWISESAATCKVPTGSGAQLDVAVTVRGGVTTLSHSFSYDFAGVTQIVLYGTSPESSTGLQVPVRPAPEVAMLDFYRQGVFVSDMPIVASILPLDSRANVDVTLSGTLVENSRASGRTTFTNLLIDSLGLYRLTFALAGTPKDFTPWTFDINVLLTCKKALQAYSPQRSEVAGGGVLRLFLSNLALTTDVYMKFGKATVSVPTSDMVVEYNAETGLPTFTTISLKIPAYADATDGSGSWFVPAVMTARNYEGPVETCFMFEYKNPAAMLATGVFPPAAAQAGGTLLSVVLENVLTEMEPLTDLTFRFVSPFNASETIATVKINKVLVAPGTDKTAVVSVIAPATQEPLSNVMMWVLKPRGTLNAVGPVFADGTIGVAKFPVSFTRGASTLNLASAITTTGSALAFSSPLSGGVKVALRISFPPAGFPSGVTILVGAGVEDLCFNEPARCVSVQASMITSMINLTRSDGSRGIASARVEFVTPPALVKGEAALGLQWTNFNSTEVHTRLEGVSIEYIEKPALVSVDPPTISVEGGQVMVVISNPLPVFSVSNLNLTSSGPSDASFRIQSVKLMAITDTEMRVRLTLATASAATLSILVAPSSSLLPAGIDVAWSAVPVEITYFLPSPVLVSALPRSLLFDRAASVTVVVKYLRQVGYPDEVTAFIAGVAVPTAGITIDYSEQFLASITLATKRLPAPGIYPLVILTGSGALATSLTTSLTFRDASVTVTCASGCVSDSVAGKRASFSFSAEMDWSNFTVQVGGVVVPVSAVKATVAGKKFLVTVNSLPSLGTVQAASAVVITSGRADVSVVVTSQADDSMTAETSIYYVTAPEVASAQVDATGCSVVVKLDQATNKAGMTGAWVACDAILRTIPSGGSQPVPFRFGNASKCVWTTNMEITATTSNGASLVPGDRVVITPSAASLLRSADGVSRTHAQDASTAATGRTLLISAAPPVPVVSVVGPQMIGPCNAAVIRATAASCRPLTYVWRCTNDADLDAELRKLAPGEGTAKVRNDWVLAGLEYVITVQVRDFQGTWSRPATHRVTKIALEDLPGLSVVAKGPYFRARPASFQAKAEFSPCASTNGRSTLLFEWSISPGATYNRETAFFSRTGPALTIPPSTLNGSSVYATLLSAMTASGSRAEFLFSFSTDAADLVASLSTDGGGVVSRSGAVTLDASGSYDPDTCSTPPCPTAGLTFEWACYLPGGGVCRYDADKQKVTLPTGAVITVPLGEILLESEVVFEATVIKGKRRSVSQVTLSLTDALVVPIKVYLLDGTPNYVGSDGTLFVNAARQVRLTGGVADGTVPAGINRRASVSLSWSITPPALCGSSAEDKCIIDISTPVFVLRPGVLAAGERATIRLTAAGSDGVVSTGFAQLAVQINRGPTLGGACDVSPSSGLELLEDFSVSCFGWTDEDLPITYAYGVRVDSPGGKDIFTPFKIVDTAVLRLPRGQQILSVRAADAFGAVSETWQSLPVSVNAQADTANSPDAAAANEDAITDAVTEMEALGDYTGALAFGTTLGASLESDAASSSRRRLLSADDEVEVAGYGGASRKLLASSAAYRMRVRRMMLRKIDSNAAGAGPAGNALVVQGLASLTASPSEITPDAVSTASATISSVTLTADQINNGAFDSIIETATFLQQASLRAPALMRARASLLLAQSLRANAAVVASGMLNQDAPRLFPADTTPWLVRSSKHSITSSMIAAARDPAIVQTGAISAARETRRALDHGWMLVTQVSGGNVSLGDTFLGEVRVRIECVSDGDAIEVVALFLPATFGWNLAANNRASEFMANAFTDAADDVRPRSVAGIITLRSAVDNSFAASSSIVNTTVATTLYLFTLPLATKDLTPDDKASLSFYKSAVCYGWAASSSAETGVWSSTVCDTLGHNATHVNCSCPGDLIKPSVSGPEPRAAFVTAAFLYQPPPPDVEAAPAMAMVLTPWANTEARDFVIFMQVCVALLVVFAHIFVCRSWGFGAGGKDWQGWECFQHDMKHGEALSKEYDLSRSFLDTLQHELTQGGLDERPLGRLGSSGSASARSRFLADSDAGEHRPQRAQGGERTKSIPQLTALSRAGSRVSFEEEELAAAFPTRVDGQMLDHQESPAVLRRASSSGGTARRKSVEFTGLALGL